MGKFMGGTMNPIITEYADSVAVVKLNRGTTNPVNPELVAALSGKLNELELDQNVRSIVITSPNEKFFSIGLDIPELFKMSRDTFMEFIRSFDNLCLELYAFPKPIIGALTGHAIAAGCILALCCDYRVIASKKKLMGLNEIKLGVPIPYPAETIIRQVVGVRMAREIMETGEFYLPEALLSFGMVDEVVPIDQVLERSIERGRIIGDMPRTAYQIIKRNRTQPVVDLTGDRLEENEKLFVDCWFSEETRERLKDAVKKF